MYKLPYFTEEDSEKVIAFMKENSFAVITGFGDEYPVASHIPLAVHIKEDGRIFLCGHLMKNTDHHKAFEKNKNVLAVFTSPHVYVSGTWYDNPQQASTWNYMSVQAKGTIRFGNKEDLIAILKRLTLHYENNNTASTTVFDNLTSEYTEPLLKAIVAFEVEVLSIDNVFKLSQNRNEKSFQNIMDKLNEQGSDGKFIAGEMKKIQHQLFGK